MRRDDCCRAHTGDASIDIDPCTVSELIRGLAILQPFPLSARLLRPTFPLSWRGDESKLSFPVLLHNHPAFKGVGTVEFVCVHVGVIPLDHLWCG